MAKKKKPAGKKPDESEDQPQVEEIIGDKFARTTIYPELLNPKQRKLWKLPENDDDRGPYMVELNLQHVGGLPGAANAFVALYKEHVYDFDATPATAAPAPAEPGVTPESKINRRPVRVSKTYYTCNMSVTEWRRLLKEDERAAEKHAKTEADRLNAAAAAAPGKSPGASPGAAPAAQAVARPAQYRAIYRLWPDFPVKALMHRSLATIKADAAYRSFDAGGHDIVWAVIDSGIHSAHPHFAGDPKDPLAHTLTGQGVERLHRCFGNYVKKIMAGGNAVLDRLDDPDADPTLPKDERDKLIDRHVAASLTDDFGHGTHVAGIIAGGLSDTTPSSSVKVFEKEFKTDESGSKTVTYAHRGQALPSRFRGVAPRCRLVSLRVLDNKGEGRSSDVIRALEYVREHLNDDPKLLRVHGVNLSVGYEYDAEMFACGQSPLCAAVDRLVQAGVVVVAAAGNTGYATINAQQRVTKVGLSNTINDPGNAASAITVGSTHRDSPFTYGVSYFSSKGPTGDGRLKPDLVAPGERITSCAAGKKLADALGTQPGQPAPNGAAAYYVDDSGTSMAAPHVSGAIAAFLSIRREFIGKPLEVKRIFLQSATPLGREKYFEGHGLVDLMRAIQSV